MDDTDPGNNVHETLLRVKQDIKAGQQVNPEDMALLKDKLGGNTDAPHSQELVDTLGHQNTLNAIKAAGNWDKGSGTFMGGLSGSPIAQKYLHPLSVGGIKADVYANIAGTVAHSALPASLHALSNATASPWLMAAEPILRSSVYGAMKGADALTGNRSPLRQFTDRFSSDGGGATSAPPTEPPRGLSFLQNQRMQDLAAKAVQKSAGQAVGEANSESAGSVDSSGMTKSLKATASKAKEDAKVLAKAQKAAQAPKVTKSVPETTQKPVNGNVAPQATPVAKHVPKAPKDSPDEPYPEDKYHKITVGSQTVYRSKEGIKDDARYIAATKTNMRGREIAVKEAKSLLPPKELPKLHGILTWLNKQPNTWSEAYSHIEDVVNSLPEAHQAKVMDALSKVKGTFKEQ
jgi:hypothetical protein